MWSLQLSGHLSRLETREFLRTRAWCFVLLATNRSHLSGARTLIPGCRRELAAVLADFLPVQLFASWLICGWLGWLGWCLSRRAGRGFVVRLRWRSLYVIRFLFFCWLQFVAGSAPIFLFIPPPLTFGHYFLNVRWREVSCSAPDVIFRVVVNGDIRLTGELLFRTMHTFVLEFSARCFHRFRGRFRGFRGALRVGWLC